MALVRGDRLKQARREAGLTLERAADVLGTSFNTIWRYEAEQHRPSGPTLYALASLYNRPVEWFFAEVEEPPTPPSRLDSKQPDSPLVPDTQGFNDSLDQIKAGIATLESFVRAQLPPQSAGEPGPDVGLNPYDPSDRSPVEVLEVASAAGGGAEVYDETPVGLLWFRNDWLQSHSIDPRQSHIISVRGESMDPTLPDGCSILVDHNRREPQDGRIYVMRTEQGLVVKRLRLDDMRHWEMLSDNPDWETMPMRYGTDIIGEVRWAARTF